MEWKFVNRRKIMMLYYNNLNNLIERYDRDIYYSFLLHFLRQSAFKSNKNIEKKNVRKELVSNDIRTVSVIKSFLLDQIYEKKENLCKIRILQFQ